MVFKKQKEGKENKTAKTRDLIPSYLKPFIVEQHYERYTSRDHAVWRFIMRQARELFKTKAHPIYLGGLSQSGIPLSRIPNIKEMDKTLQKFSWRAICVRGFIPSQIFLDFFAHKILPIAADMRSIEHIAYTPAPDIVHEAAGHAPILADSSYSAFLEAFGKVASKAIYSDEDIKLYNSIRELSDLKENPDATEKETKQAEANLEKTIASITWDSEASMLSRMFWWTAEYGLVNSGKEPKIYGAGLLSSLGESVSCFSPKVKKIPFSAECTKRAFDITKPQPQLFVAKDFKHLGSVLERFSQTLSYKKGGLEGLRLAKKAKAVTTTVFDSDFEVSGILKNFKEIKGSDSLFLEWSDPIQISYKGSALKTYSKEEAALGFFVFLGDILKTSEDLSFLSLGKEKGSFKGESFVCFDGGMRASGSLQKIERHGEKGFILSWSEVSLESKSSSFEKVKAKDFQMIFGTKVISVYGGVADRESFNFLEQNVTVSSPLRTSPFSKNEKALFFQYKEVRALRHKCEDALITQGELEEQLASLTRNFFGKFSREWLLGVEIFELGAQFYKSHNKEKKDYRKKLKNYLLVEGNFSEIDSHFAKEGVKISALFDNDPLRELSIP